MQNYFDNEATSSTLHATMKPARGGKCLVTLSTYEDRKEALLNTTIKDDVGTCRSKVTKNINTTQSRQKTESLDSKETKQEAHSHIPKPPPLQMTSNNNIYKNNNHSPQKTSNSSSSSSNKSFTINDQLSAPRLSNSSQNSNSNVYHGNDSLSRSNKTPTATSNNHNSNRQTLRLGTVTIGEYRQQTLRREPEKFDFITTQKRTRSESGETTPTNEALQSELQNTSTRANLRKSNGNSYTEHQRNCPLHQQQQQLHQRQGLDYDNNGFAAEEVTKKLQKSSLNENNSKEMLTKTNNRLANHTNGTTGVGILKNGNRNGNSSNKSIEKSIKFG